MKSTFYHLGLLLSAAMCGPAHAQIRPAVLTDPQQNVQPATFQLADERLGLQHGKLVRLTTAGKNDESIKGVVVRVDRANDRLYLRTAPGLPPRSIVLSEIKSLDKGVIRQVGFAGDVSVPEIWQLEVYNGGQRTVMYPAPTLSPGELAQLGALQQAQNDLARLEGESAIEIREAADHARLALIQRERQQLINDHLQLVNDHLRQYPPGNTDLRFMRIHAGSAVTPNPLFLNESLATIIPPAIATLPVKKADNVVRVNASAAIAAVAARQTVATLQNAMIYENGSIITVVIEDRDCK